MNLAQRVSGDVESGQTHAARHGQRGPRYLLPSPSPAPYTVNPSPYSAPYTLNPTPYTLHPTPCTLNSTLYILHCPTPYTRAARHGQRGRRHVCGRFVWGDVSCVTFSMHTRARAHTHTHTYTHTGLRTNVLRLCDVLVQIFEIVQMNG